MSFRILVAGQFVALSSEHFDAINRIIAYVSEKLRIAKPELDIYLVPKRTYEVNKVASMLRQINLFNNVHVSESLTITEAFLQEKNINCVVEFSPSIFTIEANWKVIDIDSECNETKQFVLKVNQPHPDIIQDSHLFRYRTSPRKLSREPIPQPIIDAVLDDTHYSPSSGNTQGWNIIYITNRDIMQQLCDASYHQERVVNCAGIFAFVCDKERTAKLYKYGAEEFSFQDATIACTHMQLAFESHGIGSRWIGGFVMAEVQRILGVGDKKIAGLLTFGRSIEDRDKHLDRLPMEEIYSSIE